MATDPGLEARLRRFAPGAALVRSWSLKGGISANMTVLEYEQRPSRELQRVVVREQTWGALPERRQLLERELGTLRALRRLGLLAPRAHCVDVADDGEPALLREYVEGRPNLSPRGLPQAMREMARVLWHIHRVDARNEALAFLPNRTRETASGLAREPPALDASLDEARIRAALPPVAEWPLANGEVLLHGDYWPGNLLWRDECIVCVVDWEESAVGDPLFDFAIARLDVLFAFGQQGLHAFSEAYLALGELDTRALPHWDLVAALRPMHHLEHWASSYPEPPIDRPDITLNTLRLAHAEFVRQALDALR